MPNFGRGWGWGWGWWALECQWKVWFAPGSRVSVEGDGGGKSGGLCINNKEKLIQIENPQTLTNTWRKMKWIFRVLTLEEFLWLDSERGRRKHYGLERERWNAKGEAMEMETLYRGRGKCEWKSQGETKIEVFYYYYYIFIMKCKGQKQLKVTTIIQNY